VLARGVVEGRRTLANTMKYVKITASSNFGNVLTVLAASAFLPFLPMLPIQLVVQNLLYDTAQLALPWDRVDAGYLRRPRRWDAAGLAGFMLVFGPLSTLFDLATFAALGASAPAMFQTGWFLEGLASQVLILLVLRTRGQPLRDRPSRPVLLAAVTVVAAGFVIALSPLAGLVGMHAPAAGYFPWLLAILLVYGVAAQATKAAYLRRRGTWL
jgi:Mg2+-importing ATPase